MPCPSPKPDEDREDFLSRCHLAIGDEVTDPEQRNNACFRAWKSSRGEAEVERMARETFDPDKYEMVEAVAVFAEHEIDRPDGTKQRYGRDELAAIAAKCNERILDSCQWAKVSDGHTPDAEDLKKGAKPPEVLGYAGNFRLGMVGRKNPRWAILTDEYRYRDRAAYTAKRPGRSVEVWMHENIVDRFFDPIAALGSETPRLDLPMKLSRRGSVGVLKYSALTYPGGSNAYIPEVTPAKKERYGMMSEQEVDQLGTVVAEKLGPAIAQAMTSSLQTTLQPVMALLQAQQPAAPALPPVAPPPAAPVAPAVPPAPVVDEIEDEEVETEDYEADDLLEDVEDEDEPEKEKMSLANAKIQVSKYERRITDLEARLASRDREMQTLQQDRVSAMKHARLTELQSEGYVFPADRDGKKDGLTREMERVRGMSLEDFNTKHVPTIVECYQKRDVPSGPYFGAMETTASTAEAARSEASKEARAIVEKYSGPSAGRPDYGREFKRICSEKSIPL